jgi:uncharacterized Zn finger protein
MAGRFDSEWRTYVPVAKRRRQGARAQNALRRAGREVAPVELAGRRIATTFWGEAWCQNLEAYGDYANRLPRGRSYVRNGSVIDLQIERGCVRSLVSGSDLYETRIEITPLSKARWRALQSQCAGNIDSLVELLRGSLPPSVMEVVTEKRTGLFPAPKEISLDCSCPDWASLCKHLAATLYGVGARLDHAPELLFTLRGVDAAELVETAVAEGLSAADTGRPRGRRLPTAAADLSDLSDVFGIELEDGDRAAVEPTARRVSAHRVGRTEATRSARAKRARRPAADEPDPAAPATAETKKRAKPKRKTTVPGRAVKKPAKKRAKQGASKHPTKRAKTGDRKGVRKGTRKRAAKAAKDRSSRRPTSTQHASERVAEIPAMPGPATPTPKKSRPTQRKPKQRAVKKQAKKQAK